MLCCFETDAGLFRIARRLIFLSVALLSLASNISKASEIPFRLQNGLIWVEVASSHRPEPLRFILDTGAAVSVLDERICRKFGFTTRSTRPVHGIGGRTAGMWPIRAHATFGGHPLPSKLLGLNLNALSRATGSSVDGILGADFLKDKTLRIDFQRQLLTLSAGDFVAPPLGERVALKKKGNVVLVLVAVNNADRKWFRLDTGCTSSLHWVGQAAQGLPVATIAGLRDSNAKVAQVSVRIGESTVQQVEAVLHSKPLFPGEAGLLGNGYLTNYTVTLNFKSAHMILENHSYHAAVRP